MLTLKETEDIHKHLDDAFKYILQEIEPTVLPAFASVSRDCAVIEIIEPLVDDFRAELYSLMRAWYRKNADSIYDTWRTQYDAQEAAQDAIADDYEDTVRAEYQKAKGIN